MQCETPSAARLVEIDQSRGSVPQWYGPVGAHPHARCECAVQLNAVPVAGHVQVQRVEEGARAQEQYVP